MSRLILRTALFLLVALTLRSQVDNKVQNQTEPSAKQIVTEPDFAEVFFRLDAGKLTPLERQSLPIHSGLDDVKFTLPGNRSPVRFHADELLEFAVRSGIAPNKLDPATVYHLWPLAVSKKSRTLQTAIVHITGFFSSSSKTVDGLPIEFTLYGSSSVKLKPKPLPLGEYALGQSHGVLESDLPRAPAKSLGFAVYCFGIDGPTPAKTKRKK
jgi:hypothetical protein